MKIFICKVFLTICIGSVSFASQAGTAVITLKNEHIKLPAYSFQNISFSPKNKDGSWSIHEDERLHPDYLILNDTGKNLGTIQFNVTSKNYEARVLNAPSEHRALTIQGFLLVLEKQNSARLWSRNVGVWFTSVKEIVGGDLLIEVVTSYSHSTEEGYLYDKILLVNNKVFGHGELTINEQGQFVIGVVNFDNEFLIFYRKNKKSF